MERWLPTSGRKGVVHKLMARYFPEQNGVAERLNPVLMEGHGRCSLSWGCRTRCGRKVVVTANYIRKRTTVSTCGKTPWEAFYGKKPEVSHMRVFGARAFMHVPGKLRHKLEPVSEKGWFIGFEANAKAYKLLREQDNRMIVP
jgi:hypothetical protein